MALTIFERHTVADSSKHAPSPVVWGEQSESRSWHRGLPLLRLSIVSADSPAEPMRFNTPPYLTSSSQTCYEFTSGGTLVRTIACQPSKDRSVSLDPTPAGGRTALHLRTFTALPFGQSHTSPARPQTRRRLLASTAPPPALPLVDYRPPFAQQNVNVNPPGPTVLTLARRPDRMHRKRVAGSALRTRHRTGALFFSPPLLLLRSPQPPTSTPR